MKIFRPNFKSIQENIHGFSKIQRNAIPVNLQQKATINQIKTEYSGFSGTPDQTLTGGLPLRRRSLYTTELQGHMQKYSIVQLRWTRDRQMLGGGPSILVRYRGISVRTSLPQKRRPVNAGRTKNDRSPSPLPSGLWGKSRNAAFSRKKVAFASCVRYNTGLESIPI